MIAVLACSLAVASGGCALHPPAGPKLRLLAALGVNSKARQDASILLELDWPVGPPARRLHAFNLVAPPRRDPSGELRPMRSTLLSFALLAATAGSALAEPGTPAEAAPSCRPPKIEHLLLDPPGPGVAAVQAWAVDAMALPGDAASLLKEARGRGALPLIRLKGRFADSDRRDWDEVQILESQRRDSGYSVEVQLEWDLAELSSGTDLFRAAREGRELAELRAAVRAEATALWFDRKRLLIAERGRCGSDPGEALEARLRREEVEASLDALTGGRFLSGVPAPPRRSSPDPSSPSAPPGSAPKRESAP